MSELCILHVDDDQNIRALTALAFELSGDARVHSAVSGADALRLLADGLQPDLLLLDVMMPDMDGPALLAEIRGMSKSMPAIFMTAQTQDHEIARLLGRGAIGVVIKPFDPLTLGDQVRGMLRGSA
ncbi:response regulator [Brevundimonas viscosa]|uniref:Response regulator receiver domain-containing protein n=1 Tax=Brevundimonas viscosa TaxID=871741 RepID=A0A1I6TAJ9_9CAUL|nr:response regulator [Brevundimonas viscosa]SFS86143.1 Response regulator receiver domain-containing protein [Brevundimonas viscosa]